jgi:hypothetical protein
MSQTYLCDYARSKVNRDLLVRFSRKKLALMYPDHSKSIATLLEVYLDDCLANAIEKCKNWSITSENIADLNVLVWKDLKIHVDRSLKNIQKDPSETSLFKERQVIQFNEDKIEGLAPERTLGNLEARYMKTWK